MRVLSGVAMVVAIVAILAIPIVLNAFDVVPREIILGICGFIMCVAWVVLIGMFCKRCYDEAYEQEMQHLMQEKSATYDPHWDRSLHDRGSIASGHDTDGSTAINSTESNV